MRKLSCVLACSVFAVSLLAVAPEAEAAGCLKGAVVGGVAGHLVHHGIVGAVAGCAVGHHEASKAARERARQARESPNYPGQVDGR